MAQANKLCPVCNTVGHSKFYCKDKPVKAIKRSPLKATARFAPVSNPKAIHKNKPVKKKAPTRSQLVKKLDKVFSEFIRIRDDGKGCVTCGEVKPWREMQNCHFYSRGKIPTRWEETNCWSGCYRCNVLLKGNYIEYTKYMIDLYGREYVDELGRKASSGQKTTTLEIKDMIEDYTAKVAIMLQTKS